MESNYKSRGSGKDSRSRLYGAERFDEVLEYLGIPREDLVKIVEERLYPEIIKGTDRLPPEDTIFVKSALMKFGAEIVKGCKTKRLNRISAFEAAEILGVDLDQLTALVAAGGHRNLAYQYPSKRGEPLLFFRGEVEALAESGTVQEELFALRSTPTYIGTEDVARILNVPLWYVHFWARAGYYPEILYKKGERTCSPNLYYAHKVIMLAMKLRRGESLMSKEQAAKTLRLPLHRFLNLLENGEFPGLMRNSKDFDSPVLFYTDKVYELASRFTGDRELVSFDEAVKILNVPADHLKQLAQVYPLNSAVYKIYDEEPAFFYRLDLYGLALTHIRGSAFVTAREAALIMNLSPRGLNNLVRRGRHPEIVYRKPRAPTESTLYCRDEVLKLAISRLGRRKNFVVYGHNRLHKPGHGRIKNVSKR